MSKQIRHILDTTVPLINDISTRYGRPKDIDLELWPGINKKLWGLKKKKLVVVAGRPSMGKSTLLMNMAWSISKKSKTLYCNLETTIAEFMERLFCYSQDMDNFDVTTGYCIHDSEYIEKVNRFHKECSERDLIVAESYGETFPEILDVIEKTGGGYDIIFIDYLQRIKTIGKSERECIDMYLNRLCDLAIDKNICIILASQINRATHEGKNTDAPMMHEMKSSGGIEEKAHQVWLLHWPYWYNKDNDINHYELRIAKNKDGRIGKYEMKYEPKHYKITEVENVETPTRQQELGQYTYTDI